MGENRTDFESDVVLEHGEDIDAPRKYAVVMHNDHFTTMEFVIQVLMQVFHHPAPEAERLMNQIHHRGSAVAGIFSREIAETKVAQVTAMAKKAGFPLRCTVEPE